jgi:hypothetical protein
MRPVFLLYFSCVSLLLALTPIHAPSAQGKPAAAPKVGDYYSLGPLGGKAVPAAGAAAGGAKSGLCVKALRPKCAGIEAGLAIDDIIIGFGDKLFEARCYAELAGAIEAAENATTDEGALLKLKVLRKGETKELSVKLAPFGAANNAGGKPGETVRDALVKDALLFLARQQQSDGSFPCTLNAEPGIVVQTCLAGLAFLAAGNTAEKGDHANRVRKAAEFVLDAAGEQKQYRTLGGKNNLYTHWSLGYGALFLAHVYKLTDEKWLAKSSLKRIKSRLESIKGKVLSGMAPSGGFGHGPGGPNVLNYVETEVLSNLMLTALGCIKACGCELDAKKLEPMLAFCKACTDDQGNVGYSTTEPQSLIRLPTRSAGLSNALAALGLKQDPLYAKVTQCAKVNFAEAFEGHSTPIMGLLSMGLVAQRTGALEDFWKAMRGELTMARCGDGAFAYRPTNDTQMMGMNLDRDMNECWTTSHWVILLGLDKAGVPLWLGAKD